jgi:hypothetical protein
MESYRAQAPKKLLKALEAEQPWVAAGALPEIGHGNTAERAETTTRDLRQDRGHDDRHPGVTEGGRGRTP